MDECIDMIQARYGWTDADLAIMPYGRFSRVVQVVVEKVKAEARDKLRQGAWIAFQIGAGGEMSYGDYLDKMGLSEKERVAPNNITAQQAIAKAEQILEKARERI